MESYGKKSAPAGRSLPGLQFDCRCTDSLNEMEEFMFDVTSEFALNKIDPGAIAARASPVYISD